MDFPHDDYQKTHRMPRVLIVANDITEQDGKIFSYTTARLAMNLDCHCLKFVAKGADNVHVLVPAKYEKGSLACVRDVFEQSVKAERPYDLIIVDSEACRKEVAKLADGLDPKPGVVLYVPDRYAVDAAHLRKTGIAAFNGHELVLGPPFDEQVERALGAEGIKRLEVQSPKDGAFQQWLGSETRVREVEPSGAIRKPTKSGDGKVSGLA